MPMGELFKFASCAEQKAMHTTQQAHLADRIRPRRKMPVLCEAVEQFQDQRAWTMLAITP